MPIFFYPHTLTLATNDACLGLSVMLLPLRAFTDDYLTMMNVGMWVSFPLSAHAVYLFVRDASGPDLATAPARTRAIRRAGAIVAGFLFAFSAYRYHQLDHPGLEQMQWLPYLAWALLHTAKAPTARRLLALAPFLGMALFASSNLAIYSVPAIVILGLFYLLMSAQRKRYLLVCVAAASLVAIPLVPIYLQHFEGVHNFNIVRGLGEIISFSAVPAQFFAAPPFLALWGPRFGERLGGESATFLTATALALLPFAFFTGPGGARRRVVQVLLVPLLVATAGVVGIVHPIPAILAGVLAFAFAGYAFWVRRTDAPLFTAWLLAALAVTYAVFAVGPKVPWGGRVYLAPWAALVRLPGFASVRTPSRFWFVVTFAVASLAGLGLIHLAQAVHGALPRLRARWAPRLASALLVLLAAGGAVAETRPTAVPTRRLIARRELPPAYQWLANTAPRGPVLELPRYNGRRERERLYFSNFHHRPTVAGESGVLLPIAFRFFNENLGDGILRAKFEEMHAIGVRTVLIDSGAWPGSSERPVVAALSALGAERGPTFGATKTFLLPATPRPSRPFSWEDPAVLTQLRFEPAPTERVTLVVANRSDDVLYGDPSGARRGVFEATLAATLVRPNGRTRSITIPFRVAPPLVAGKSVFAIESHFPPIVGEVPPGTAITYTLQIGDGPVSAPRTFVLPEAKDPPGPCRLSELGRARTLGGATRVLYTVTGAAPELSSLTALELDPGEDRPALPGKDSTGYPIGACTF